MPKSPDDTSTKQAAQFLASRLVLTSRQAEVLHWIAEGKTNQEIGVILGCSFFTVKNHVKEIFARLGVSTRVGAAATAYRAHLDRSDALPKKAPTARRKSSKNGSRL